MTDPEYLTVTETAALLRCAPATVRKAVRAGQLPRLQIGTRIRIPAAFFAAARVTPTDRPPAPVGVTRGTADDGFGEVPDVGRPTTHMPAPHDHRQRSKRS